MKSLSGPTAAFSLFRSFTVPQGIVRHTALSIAGVALFVALPLTGAAEETVKPVAAVQSDAAAQKRIDDKLQRMLKPLKLEDAAKIERVRAVGTKWLGELFAWHKQNDAELGKLWGEWRQARSVVPKDEFNGEVVSRRIEALYASLLPAYRSFIEGLSADLSIEQVDALKEAWSRSPGMERTYKAYLEIVPDLTEEQKKVIRDRMLLAREAAMLTDSDKEIVNLFKVHKVKVETYVGSLQWEKLHKAYAAKAKAAK